MRSLLSVTAASSLLVLAACGGGGGDSPNSNSAATPRVPTTITSANYVAVGAQSVATALSMTAYADYGTISTAAVSKTKHPENPHFLSKAYKFSMREIERALASSETTSDLIQTSAVVQKIVACDKGGSYTTRWNDANNNNIQDSGDSLSTEFTNCNDGADILNGSFSFSVGQLTGTIASNSYNYAAAVSFSNFVLASTSGSDNLRISGNIALSISSTASNNKTFTVDVPNLTASASIGGQSFVYSLSSFNLREVYAPLGSAYTVSTSISGTMSQSDPFFSGSVTLQTVNPFIRNSSSAYPYTGQILVTGQNGSRVRVTANNTSTVRIELDADGNGAFEATQNVYWSQLV